MINPAGARRYAAWQSLSAEERQTFRSYDDFADKWDAANAGGAGATEDGRAVAQETTTMANGEDTLTVLKCEWARNRRNERGVPLQDEFGGDEEAFVAFKTHEAAGDITICTKRAATGGADAGEAGRSWEQLSRTEQGDYGDRASYEAFVRHFGDVTIAGASVGVRRG
jgi:hypothetical protein